MELICTEFLGKPLRLEASLSGWQQLYWNGQVVSERVASPDTEGYIEHHFQVLTGAGPQLCCLAMQLQWQPLLLQYRLTANGEQLAEGSCTAAELERQSPQIIIAARKPFSLIGLFSLATKLLKSAKAVKVAMAGASVAAYSWLFSLPFALCLLACLVFHEYGHLRAMRYFGMKTKGIYLIPFIGGLALGDDKINTRWQDVVISIMGPTFGLFLSLLPMLLYAMTGEIFFAGLASFNALLNLFNLLPVLPLDGGHVLKSISFSMHSKIGLLCCALGVLLGVFLSYRFGLALLGFMLAIGLVDVLLEWRSRHESRLLPLDRYGQVVATVWYILVVAGLAATVVYLAALDDPVLGLPKLILQS